MSNDETIMGSEEALVAGWDEAETPAAKMRVMAAFFTNDEEDDEDERAMALAMADMMMAAADEYEIHPNSPVASAQAIWRMADAMIRAAK